MIPLAHVLTLSAILFTIGVAGVLVRRNAIIVFMCIELMLNAVNVAFIDFAAHMQSMVGVMFVFFVLVVAAAEAVVGLSIMLQMFRAKGSLEIERFNLLRW